jgi:predicted DNA-binding transcriptional regulator YafY
MTLQARGRVTAQQLADDADVSLRTIYRDIDELSAAGVPVYSERGADGGYRLLDGYRTKLNGLSPQEAEALFLTGLPGAAADLGLGTVMAAAQLKLLAALPAELRTSAERVRSRFHLDAPGWFGETEKPAWLPEIAGAIWKQQCIQIRYRSWKAEKQRQIEPLGIVLKGGSWYLIGQVERSVRNYRIARILSLTVLSDRFERPKTFDLEAYWCESTRRLEEQLHPQTATVRFSPIGMKLMEAFLSPFVRAGMHFSDKADADGWRTATMPVGSMWHATCELLRFGTDAEVLEPPELRTKMAETVTRLGRVYEQTD